jgi:hypothetical protein
MTRTTPTPAAALRALRAARLRTAPATFPTGVPAVCPWCGESFTPTDPRAASCGDAACVRGITRARDRAAASAAGLAYAAEIDTAPADIPTRRRYVHEVAQPSGMPLSTTDSPLSGDAGPRRVFIPARITDSAATSKQADVEIRKSEPDGPAVAWQPTPDPRSRFAGPRYVVTPVLIARAYAIASEVLSADEIEEIRNPDPGEFDEFASLDRMVREAPWGSKPWAKGGHGGSYADDLNGWDADDDGTDDHREPLWFGEDPEDDAENIDGHLYSFTGSSPFGQYDDRWHYAMPDSDDPATMAPWASRAVYTGSTVEPRRGGWYGPAATDGIAARLTWQPDEYRRAWSEWAATGYAPTTADATVHIGARLAVDLDEYDRRHAARMVVARSGWDIDEASPAEPARTRRDPLGRPMSGPAVVAASGADWNGLNIRSWSLVDGAGHRTPKGDEPYRVRALVAPTGVGGRTLDTNGDALVMGWRYGTTPPKEHGPAERSQGFRAADRLSDADRRMVERAEDESLVDTSSRWLNERPLLGWAFVRDGRTTDGRMGKLVYAGRCPNWSARPPRIAQPAARLRPRGTSVAGRAPSRARRYVTASTPTSATSAVCQRMATACPRRSN